MLTDRRRSVAMATGCCSSSAIKRVRRRQLFRARFVVRRKLTVCSGTDYTNVVWHQTPQLLPQGATSNLWLASIYHCWYAPATRRRKTVLGCAATTGYSIAVGSITHSYDVMPHHACMQWDQIMQSSRSTVRTTTGLTYKYKCGALPTILFVRRERNSTIRGKTVANKVFVQFHLQRSCSQNVLINAWRNI